MPAAGHGLIGEHELTPLNAVDPFGHDAPDSTTAHAPHGSQHAVGCGQVVGPHAELIEALEPLGQATPGKATEHAPVVVLQHAVGCGQSCAEQAIAPPAAATVPDGHD